MIIPLGWGIELSSRYPYWNLSKEDDGLIKCPACGGVNWVVCYRCDTAYCPCRGDHFCDPEKIDR